MDLESAQPNKISGIQIHKIPVPARRYKPLKEVWVEMYSRIDEEMKIDIQMNHKARRVEIKTRPDTPDASNLQRSADFVRAFMFVFNVFDAILILWKDELSVESFQILDVIEWRMMVNVLKAKFAIDNSTRTRILIHHSTIHILGSLANTRVEAKNLLDIAACREPPSHFVRPPSNLVVLEGECSDTGDAGELGTSDLYRDFILLDSCDAVAVDDFFGSKAGRGRTNVCRDSSVISKDIIEDKDFTFQKKRTKNRPSPSLHQRSFQNRHRPTDWSISHSLKMIHLKSANPKILHRHVGAADILLDYVSKAKARSLKLACNKQTGHPEELRSIEFLSHAAANNISQIYNGTLVANTDQAFPLNGSTLSMGERSQTRR